MLGGSTLIQRPGGICRYTPTFGFLRSHPQRCQSTSSLFRFSCNPSMDRAMSQIYSTPCKDLISCWFLWLSNHLNNTFNRLFYLVLWTFDQLVYTNSARFPINSSTSKMGKANVNDDAVNNGELYKSNHFDSRVSKQKFCLKASCGFPSPIVFITICTRKKSNTPFFGCPSIHTIICYSGMCMCIHDTERRTALDS